MSIVSKLKQWLATSVPNRCQLCQQVVLQGQGLCHCCLNDLTPPLLCSRCTAPLTPVASMSVAKTAATPTHSTWPRCGACLNKPLRLPIIAAYPYHHPLGQLVGHLKTQQQWHLLTALCQPLVAHQQRQSQPDLLVPIPMSRHALQQRGCNHAVRIADELGRQLAIPVATELLTKTRHTPNQRSLNGRQRRRNLHGSFHATKATPSLRLALVDDVVTTGSTLTIAAKALMQQGHQVSHALVLASAMHR